MKSNISKKISMLLQLLTLVLVAYVGYTSYQQQGVLQATGEKVASITEEVSYVHDEFKKAVELQKQGQGLAQGDIAPEFSLLDTEKTEQRLVNLAPNKQKLLVFSSANCPYCKEYYPELHNFAENNADIEVVVIQTGATLEENKQLLQENDFSFKVLEGTPEVFRQYLVNGTPTSLLVSKDNIVQAVGYPITEAELTTLVENSKMDVAG